MSLTASLEKGGWSSAAGWVSPHCSPKARCCAIGPRPHLPLTTPTETGVVSDSDAAEALEEEGGADTAGGGGLAGGVSPGGAGEACGDEVYHEEISVARGDDVLDTVQRSSIWSLLRCAMEVKRR
jgi:hypothetical protein